MQQPPHADVLTVLAVLLRRWMIMLPGLALAGAASYLVYEDTEPEYEVSGTVLLSHLREAVAADGLTAGPVEATDTAPMIALSGPALAEIVQGDAERAALARHGATADYSVEFDTDPGFFRIEASSEDEGAAIATVEAVMTVLADEVAARQEAAGVPDDERVAVEVLSPPSSTPLVEESGSPDGELETQYVASGVMALLGDFPDTGGRSYPLSRATTEILVQVMNSPQMQREVAPDAAVSYSVHRERQDEALILYIDVQGPAAGEVIDTFERVREAMQEELDARQAAAGTSQSAWLVLEPLAVPEQAEVVDTSPLRASLTVLGLGVALTVAAALLLEAVLNALARRRAHRRLSRRRGRQPPPGPGDVASDGADVTGQTELGGPNGGRAKQQTDEPQRHG